MREGNLALSFGNSICELKPAGTFQYSRLASELAEKGKEIISFGIGEPDFPTPRHIVNAAINALRDGFTKYVPPQGIPEFREEIARHVSEFTGTGDIIPEETMVLPGAKQAIFLAIASYVEPGDEVVIPDPSFYSYEHLTRYAGGKPIFVPLKEENDFRMLPEDVQTLITNRTKMIIINSPHNPTGTVLTEADIRGILDLAKENSILVVSDEVYDHYIYEERFTSVLTDPEWRDFVVYINSLSKTYSMTGWRLGYIVANKEAINRFTLFAVNSYSCTTSFAQKAGVAALSGPQDFFVDILEKYRKRRDFLYHELNKIRGVRAKNPAGAFYIFPNIKEILEQRKLSTEEIVMQLLKKTGVVMLPGTAFPHKAGEGYLRISYGLPIKDISKGLEKFKEFL
ncbi:MAG: pyridoxal phosphate-dependent aminotransferase [Candidatus Bathyarchaeota archaeon]|nr:pyridoxal phosphate-dependent aminotransferase [Candidatus Bathyarchaeota archaeon]MDH5732333.1 pyridoxal phosphate-dependent aminotransferase [Candidatus Bathyarchaeota archaeon]